MDVRFVGGVEVLLIGSAFFGVGRGIRDRSVALPMLLRSVAVLPMLLRSVVLPKLPRAGGLRKVNGGPSVNEDCAAW
jgi:hypothetical protein